MTEGESVRRFSIAGLSAEVHNNKDALGGAAAQFVGNAIREAVALRGAARLVLATGASQYEFLEALRRERDLDWGRVTAFHLDEYLGLTADHPASFRRYLHERVFQHLTFREIHLLQGEAADAEAECRRYAALLAQAPIDVACIGIGENGHLAFNDPPADFDAPGLVHVVSLDDACRRQQVGEGHFASLEAVPPKALSMTVPAILSAGVISCVVPDRRKAEAVRCSLQGPITPFCPGSVLRTHLNCRLFLDVDSASLLSLPQSAEMKSSASAHGPLVRPE
jgi:glucosamine-6-phosphate deaminase